MSKSTATEITVGYKSDEVLEVWSALLALHNDLKLGNEVTHPQRQALSEITKQVMVIANDLADTRCYVKEKK